MFSKKKLLTVCLSAVLLCTAFLPVQAAVYTDMEENAHKNAVDILSDIGIVKGMTETEFVPEASLTRAEMTTILLRLINLEGKAAVGAPAFADVTEEHWAYHNIMTAYEMGLVNGISECSFAPDEAVTFAQAVKLLVTLLGYGEKAEALGGYPAGYIIAGHQLDLTKGITENNSFTRGDMAELVYNALEIKLFDKVSYGDDASRYETAEDTILNRYLHISHYKAKVGATYMGAVSTPTRKLAENEVYFENELVANVTPLVSFIADCSEAEEYLGAVCDVYIKESAEKTQVVSLSPAPGTKIVEVDAKDILENTTTSLFQYMEGDKEYEVEIAGAAFVHNGQTCAMTESALMPAVGTVRLISKDRGHSYDTVIAESYQDYVVSSVNYDNDTVYFTDGTSMVLSLTDTAFSTVIRDSEGKKIEAYDLYAEDVISIAEGGRYRKVWRSNKAVEGVVTEKTDDAFIIGGKTYALSEAFLATASPASFEMGADYVFYLDFNEQIVKAEKYREYMYGYLVNAQAVGGIEKEPYLKVYTEEQEMAVFGIGDRLLLNGTFIQKDDLLREGEANAIWNGTGVTRQLLRFETDGKNIVTEIETATDHTKNPEAAAEDENFSLDYYLDRSNRLASYDGTTVYRENVQFVAGDIATFVGRIAPRSTTKIFIIPGADAPDDAYSMDDYNMFEHNTSYPDMEFYDTGETFVPGAIVYHQEGRTGSSLEYPTYYVEHALVQKVYTGMNKDGEVASMLDVYTTSGVKKTIRVDEDFRCLYKAANADIVKDIYWYTRKDSDGQTTRVMPVPGGNRSEMFLDAGDLRVGDIIQFEADITGKASMISVKYRAGELAANVLTGGTNDVSVLDKYNYYASGVTVAHFERANNHGFIAEGLLADTAGRPTGEKASYFFTSTGSCLLVDQKTGDVKRITVDDLYPGDVVVKIAVTYTIKAYFVYRDWK
ncbi:MAG: S-layer homology domain-containing protein [Ruminococcaceae bacterium]|nr:S-layer homology domain-containing protein [Oscillospiraceae bacterium]